MQTAVSFGEAFRTESTPGPLIMVVQFVGFLAAYQASGSLDPLSPACSRHV
jgi:hypothetical protein